MPVCSVLGCGIRKTPNQPSLSFHRLPRNEFKKKKWLEAIGLENIRPNVKDVYICSLHFDEKCFNKTLDVTRLRDDAVPLKFVRQHTSQHKPATLKENQLETIPVLAGHNVPNLVPLEIFNTSSYTALAAVTGASEIASFINPYSPDLAPSDYYLFPNLKRELRGKKFHTDDEVKDAISAHFDSKNENYYFVGLEKLISRTIEQMY